ncbi:MAG TPA: phosphate/phosphite/phosphonate ABC transporter substrate-binding protein [Bryobacteraceae bacterium]|jgi:phosphonate transport system substrate-binding protein|nr:phosphate/phosphite/phosphonate ABC transporter substrate-binding protein [Bryobacteraceae bacterium]
MSNNTLLLGAVAYDPKVVLIWDGFQAYFAKQGLRFDYILYSNYERQVAAQFAGQIHVAWNSPLAWIQSERIAAATGRKAEAIVMRDTDCDLTSIIVVRSDSPVHAVADLKGRRVAVGAADSPQATLIPLNFLGAQGLDPGTDFEVIYFDKLPGKHGDHIGGERDAVRALLRGEADAACMIDGNHLLFSQEGVIQSGTTRVLATTPTYDHCNFTVLDGAPGELVDRFRDLLLDMSYADPSIRPLLDLEGLKQWRAGRTEGYAALNQAVNRFGYVEPFVRQVAASCG